MSNGLFYASILIVVLMIGAYIAGAIKGIYRRMSNKPK
jgi:hypothetical protein